MSDFIFLGLIPGTNTELTFSVWLLVAALLLATICGRRIHRAHLLRNSLISLGLLLATRRAPVMRRLPLA